GPRGHAPPWTARGSVAAAVVEARGGRLQRCDLAILALPLTRSAFAGFSFPPDFILLGGPALPRSYRGGEELLAEGGIEVHHVTVYRWVLRFTPLLADAARPCRHAVG